MKQTESQIQSAFFEWLSLHEKKHPELGLFYAIPNGTNKSPAARMKFKREGLKSGVPDVHLPVKSFPTMQNGERLMFQGLWIEFKTQSGRPSETQNLWACNLTLHGHAVYVSRSWEQAANITIDYLNLPIKKFPIEKKKDKAGTTGNEKLTVTC